MESKQAFYSFGKTFYRLDGFYAEYAKESGVKENLLWILYALNDGNSHSQKEICDSWDLPRTTVNTIIKELENDCYVKLLQIKGEKRELEVVLTDKGKTYADSLLDKLYKIEEKVSHYLIESDITLKLNNLLNELYNAKKSIEGNE